MLISMADLSTAKGLLTIIITTSVTPSAPSTELISSVLESYRRHCPSLVGCRAIVVFDGYDRVVSEPRLKKGCVTAEQAENFSLYKENVKTFIIKQYYPDNQAVHFTQTQAHAEYGSPFDDQNVVSYTISQSRNTFVSFIEPSRRLGFGLAVRAALRLCSTPYVWVQQHDWILTSSVPIEPLLQIMQTSESDPDAPVKYVCLPAVRMLKYAVSAEVIRFPALRKLTSELKCDYSPKGQPDVKIPLTPLFFWHDKPHIACTEHYLARVFPSRLAMLRGDFIEDKIGQRARTQMKEGLFAKWATWLYYPNEGKEVCSKHLHGRTYQGAEKEAEKIALKRRQREDKMASGETRE
ncbi:hypothetical protein L207DRAFT_449590 [Hyaloscypha variabilis F]|uniref:Uncharacterized protein n=1 Tax=Hyaloscypha variabilis (strain UAMH 11265 / GT02V1 / F) TaxID=1149755 RepID=A0A2J6SAB9_HYAVF|nr:hypothetical protein L207DRAFT_449590 [Hyaloscypha variabilis F]